VSSRGVAEGAIDRPLPNRSRAHPAGEPGARSGHVKRFKSACSVSERLGARLGLARRPSRADPAGGWPASAASCRTGALRCVTDHRPRAFHAPTASQAGACTTTMLKSPVPTAPQSRSQSRAARPLPDDPVRQRWQATVDLDRPVFDDLAPPSRDLRVRWRRDEAVPTRPNPRRPRAPSGKSRAVPGCRRGSRCRGPTRRTRRGR
jgi:hypothetical protein